MRVRDLHTSSTAPWESARHRARRLPRLLALPLLAVLCGLLAPVMTTAQEPLGVDPTLVMGEPAGSPLSGAALEQRTDEVASIIRCPVCQALSVADSPTASAIAMKDEVRLFLSQGYSENQILDYFEQSYGEFIRLEPKAKGFNLVVWAAPGLALVIGLLLVIRRLRSASPTASTTASPGAEGEDPELQAYRDRVRSEVAP